MNPPDLWTGLLATTAALAFGVATAALWAAHRTRAAADELAARLEALRAQVATPTPTLAPAARTPPPREGAAGPVVRVDRPAPAAPTLIAVPDLAVVPAPARPPAAPVPDPRFAPLWELADAGATPAAIAQATGLPVGRVELILALRPRPAGAREAARR